MAIYRVEAPDGQILKIEGPEGADPNAVLAYAESLYQQKQQPVEAPPETPKERTWGEAVTDIGASLTSGVGALAQMPGQLGMLAGIYGPEESETGLQGIGKELERTGQEMKSSQLKAKEAARAEKVGQAEGVVDEFLTAIKETATDPALMTSFFAEQVPNLIGSMGAGLLTKGAVKIAMRDATEAALQKSAVAGMVGGGSIMQGADIGTETFENLYDKLRRDGMPAEKAAEIALDKGRMAAIEAAGISVATAFLPGGTTLERALVGRGLPRTGGIVKGFAGEAAQEGLEEGGGKLVSNIQEQALYPETDIFKGVGEAAGMGALMGGAFGGIGGVSLRAPRAPGEVTPVEPTAVPLGGAESEVEAIRRQEQEEELRRGMAQPGVEPTTVEPTVEPATPAEPVATPTEPVAEPAAPTEPVAPVEPAAPTGEVIDVAPLVQQFTSPEGQVDYRGFGVELGKQVYSQIVAGNQVVAYVNNEPHVIVRTEGPNLVDNKGIKISPVNFGGFAAPENRIEFFKPQEPGAEPTAPTEPRGTYTPPAEPTAPTYPQMPFGMHPAEASGFEGSEQVKQQAIDYGRQSGIEFNFDSEGKIKPRDSRISWDKLATYRNAKDLLTAIHPHVPVDYQHIIDRIAPSVGKTRIEVQRRKVSWNGQYNPNTNTAAFSFKSDVGNTFDVIIHELTHSATVTNYWDGLHNRQSQYRQAAQEMEALAQEISRAGKNYQALWFIQPGGYAKNQWGMELIARAMTNRDVQDALKKIKLGGKTTGWSKFVGTVRKLLGLDPRDDSALSRVLDLSEQLMQPTRGGRKVIKQKAEPIEQVERPIEQAPIEEKEQAQASSQARQTVTGRAITDPIWTIEPMEQKSEWSRFVDDKVYKYVDKFVDLKKVIQAINQTTKKLDSAWDAYMKETLYHNRVAYQTNEFLKNELKPLAQEMVARGVSEEELNNYLLARHADEYNQAINARNDRPDLRDRGSGVHSLIAKAYLEGASQSEVAALRKQLTQNAEPKNNIVFNANEEALLKDLAKMSDGKRRAMAEIAKRIDKMVAETQNIAVKGGIERQGTIDYWRDMYPNYVPLKRTPEELDFVETSTGMGKGFSARAGFGRAATGSLKGVDNILSNLILQRDMAIVKAEKARIGRALYAMALSHPNPSFWLPVNPNASIISKANDLMLEIVRMRNELAAVRNTIEAKRARGEQPTAEELKRSQDLSDKIRRESARQEQMAAEGEKVKQQIVDELVAMGLDPKEVDNLIREPQGAWYNPKTKQVEYRTNNYLRASQNVLAIPINGETRYIFFNPGDERAKRLVTSLRAADVEDLGQITSIVSKFTRWIAQVNTQYNPFFGIVNMIRDVQGAQFNMASTPLAGQQMEVNKKIMGAVKTIYQSLRAGEPTGEFAKDWLEFQQRGGPTGMKDMLVNQQKNESILKKEIENLQRNPTEATLRKGFIAVRDWMSDFNDTMENAVRLAAFIEAKKKFGKTMSSDVAADKAAELAKNLTVNFNRKGAKTQFVNSWFAFFNAAVQGTARLAETLKSPAGKKIMGSLVALGVIQQLILSAAFDDDDPPEFVRQKNLIIPTSDGGYLSWPMPLGFNFLVNIGRIGTSAVQSGGKNIAKDIGNILTVASESVNPLGGGSLVQMVAPTFLDPAVALYGNVDAFGRPIYRADRPSQPSPGYLRSTEGATPVSKFIAEALNRMSGGTEFQKGEISPTADHIDYIAGQLGGGTLREARKVVEAISATGKGEEIAPYRKPLIGRFVGDTGSEANVRNKFYEHVNKLAGYEAEIKGRATKGQDVAEFMASHPDAALFKVADNVYKEISKINKARKIMTEQGASKEQIKQLNDVKIQLMRQFNEMYDQVKTK